MTRFVEALIEVKRSDCKVTNAVYSVSPGISVKRLRIGSERSLHIVSCRGHMDEVKEEACKIKGANVWSSGKDLLMVDAPSCSACRAVSGIDAAVTASKSVGGQHHIVFRFLFRSNSHMKNVIKILADNGLEPGLWRYRSQWTSRRGRRRYSWRPTGRGGTSSLTGGYR